VDYEWIDNPVFRRETRILTRGKIPALLFMGGPALAAFILFIRYSAVSLAYRNQSGLAVTGREVFISLASILFWILILVVPALAGGAIHKDRSSGTLTSIRLTPLSAWSILGGKCLALGAFVGLVYLALLPILGLAFLIGGVSPSEFFGVLSVTLVCSVQCALFSVLTGLAIRRPTAAMVWGFLLTLFYLALLPWVADLLAHILDLLRSQTGAAGLERWAGGLRWFSEHLGAYFFPVRAIGAMLSPGTIPQASLFGMQIPFWMGTVLGVSTTSLLSLAGAVWLLRSETWMRPANKGVRRSARGTARAFNEKNLLDERRNPFLDWEMKRHPARLYKGWVIAFTSAACLGVVALYLYALPELYYITGIVALKIVSALTMLIPIFYCSQSIVREKEMETYDSLVLTLVEPRQIIESKIKSCFYFVMPLLTIAAIFCFFRHFIIDTPLYTPFRGGMNFIWLALQGLRCIYYAMLGAYCSLYCRSSLHALAAAFGLELLLSIPYALIFFFFTCFGGMMLAGILEPLFDQYLFFSGSLIAEYAVAALMGLYQAGFMLLVIRILHQRSVNLIRYESHRR
jgi:ABC-type transport system involved in multi-copper enzyme maturation permease subunit